MAWELSFISERDFTEHVKATIAKYGSKLEPINLQKFNSNIIDPIKLIFDKMVYQTAWEEIVKNEIYRQRDKSNNNDIGYFHQHIFKYMRNCEVPKEGWDVIFRSKEGIRTAEGEIVHTVYVEMKNKHNTMNSASSQKTYMKMQAKLLDDDQATCYLVEAISTKTKDDTWRITLDKKPRSHKRIRRMSMDKFYELVFGDPKAFYKLCMALPQIIEDVVSENEALALNNSVYEELTKEHADLLTALYLLAFSTYEGFDQIAAK